MKAIALLLLLISSLAQAQLSNQYPTSPASTITNAFSLWGDSTGGSLLNTSLLLDSSAMGTGTLTLKPTTGTTNRTFTFPDKSGTPVMNNISDTFGTTFMAESLTWFNNADPTKRMTFDISNVPASTTVAVRAPKTSGRMIVDTNTAAINNGNVVVNSASVTTGKTATLLFSNTTDQSYSFPSTGGTVMMAGSTNTLGNTRITGWLALDNYVDISDYNAINGFDPASPAGFDLRVWQKGEDLYITKDSGTQVNITGNLLPSQAGNSGKFLTTNGTTQSWGTPTASVAISTATATFSGDGETAKRVTITDASVNTSSKILVSIRQPDSADDGVQTGFQYIVNVVKVGTGSFDVFVTCTSMGVEDPTEDPPNETVTIVYTVG